MKSVYEDLFLSIIDPDVPDPTIVVNHIDHLPRIRAGLNRCRKEYAKVAELLGDDTLEDKNFTYTHDTDDEAKVTIGIVTTTKTEFTVL